MNLTKTGGPAYSLPVPVTEGAAQFACSGGRGAPGAHQVQVSGRHSVSVAASSHLAVLVL